MSEIKERVHLMRIHKWINDRPCLNIRCIEAQSCIPRKTLEHYIRGRRNLPERHAKRLLKTLREYGYPQDVKNDDFLDLL